MELLKLYYYTSVPFMTCNLLFYSISALSTSITSSQNVVKFISEHKDCDSILFQNELQTSDIINKLKIIESFIFDILKKHSNDNKEYEELKHNLASLNIVNEVQEGFTLIELNVPNTPILERIEEPIRYALLSTTEIVQQLNNTLIICNNKIKDYKKSYVKNVISLCLQKELNDFKKQTNILDKRFELLLQLMQSNIYKLK
jgi:hypothetical protein